jgi:hypothetical protein
MSENRKPATLTVRLESVRPPTLQLLKTLSDRVEDLLRELTAREELGTPIAVWLVRRVDVGSLAIEVEGWPAREQVNSQTLDNLCQQLLEDIQSIAQEPLTWVEHHPGRDSQFLHALRRLSALSVEHQAPLSVRYRNQSAEVGGVLAAKVDTLLQSRFQDWGAVEGLLEMVTLHRQRYFRLYPPGVTHGVACHFGSDSLPRVKELLGRRVLAWGRLHRSRTGSIERMEVRHVEPLETRSLDEIRPKEPLWPGKSYEELHRDAWED